MHRAGRGNSCRATPSRCLRPGAWGISSASARRKNVELYGRRRNVSKMPAKTMKNPPRPLVLASTSRYRQALLARLELPFDVEAPDVDETALPGETPAATARRLAEAKARAVAARRGNALVIGADQIA